MKECNRRTPVLFGLIHYSEQLPVELNQFFRLGPPLAGRNYSVERAKGSDATISEHDLLWQLGAEQSNL
ncbi:hypothetical protein WL93_09790 [Burkholderia diffusa]|nr:hypothetical protein WL93_09790 [Burkholderia diffusa]